MDRVGLAGGEPAFASLSAMNAMNHVVELQEGRPFDAATSQRIAEAFLPAFPLGNRYDYYYTRTKLRTDPLYPAVITALNDTRAGTRVPVLDLGCGLGLLAHALHAVGCELPYYGVDRDADKIARAQRIAAARGLRETRFDVVDLANGPPAHRGSVVVLDVLQYLDPAAQASLLRTAASMLDDDGVLVIRSAIADDSRRARTSRITDRLANLVGWMQFRPRSYPTLDGLRQALEGEGLQIENRPLYGDTPFNNWLIVARR
jgi:2-polyprenyl-3-methyl-5-hydroxy-6-metoxy-1,4-benzoquinol methylase